MSTHRIAAYQIEVLCFGEQKKKPHNDIVVPDTRGVYRCDRCGWEGKGQSRCPKCAYSISPKGKIKVVDTLPVAHRRTLLELFYNYRHAIKWGARYGTVISCQKVDKSYYLNNIEHLNLNQEPITIELEQEDYVLSKTLELERPRRKPGVGKLNVEIVRE